MNTSERNDTNRPAPLAIHLFGALDIRVHGVLLPRLHSRKGLWLLALLTLRQGKPVERDWLAGTLWPDSPESQAMAYLRQSLTELRHVFGPEATRLQTPTRHTLVLDVAGAEADVLTFDADIEQAEPLALERAVAIYRGPLLEGCTEEWVLPERAHREQSYLTALHRLAQDALSRGGMEDAIGYSRRVIAVDPLQEAAQRTLMQALVSAGDRAAAAQVYRDLRLHLHRELNAEPDPITTALYNELRAQPPRQAQTPPVSPPRISLPASPCRLPRPLTELVGREAEVVEVVARVRQRRLVTLTGIGGVGKTRLAITVAETLADEFADGAAFVELGGLSDAGLVVQAVASAIGVQEEPERSLKATLMASLRPRLLLLVLDNCEHLLEACALLAEELLQGCPGVRILATSRQALGITGEVNWQVPTLPTPDLADLPTETPGLLTQVSECAAVQLFVERAEAMQKTFTLTTRNALSIARICAHLDGIPLALELAAGNVKALPVEQIALRLDDVFGLLTRGSRTALPRQQTLRATLDWSYDLLTESERFLLERLSVFAGGWTLDAAEAICKDESERERAGEVSCSREGTQLEENAVSHPSAFIFPPSAFRLQPSDVFDVLTSLVDKSLVQFEEREGCVRYRMLETVRQYAAEKLDRSGEAQTAQRRHRAYFLTLAEEAEPHLTGADQALWLDRLEVEHDNLRAALGMERGEAALRLAGALWRFWMVRGHLSEGRERMRAALSYPETQAPTKARAHALSGAGTLARAQGDYASARSLYEQSLAMSRGLADRHGIAVSLGNLGTMAFAEGDYMTAQTLYEECLQIQREIEDRYGLCGSLTGLGAVAYNQCDYPTAREYIEESLAIKRELGDRLGVARSLGSLGGLAGSQGDYLSARRLLEESLAVRRDIGDRQGAAWSLDNLGTVACALGDFEAARNLHNESLKIQTQLGDRAGIAGSLAGLGTVAYREGDFVTARTLYAESLTIQTELGDRQGIVEALEAFARLDAADGPPTRAVTLWAAAITHRETLGTPWAPKDREEFNRNLNSLRASLPEQIFAEMWAEGSAMTLQQAAICALEGANGAG